MNKTAPVAHRESSLCRFFDPTLSAHVQFLSPGSLEENEAPKAFATMLILKLLFATIMAGLEKLDKCCGRS